MRTVTITQVFKDPRDVRPYLFVIRDDRGATTSRHWTHKAAMKARTKAAEKLRREGVDLREP